MAEPAGPDPPRARGGDRLSDRILPKDDTAAEVLRMRKLTNLYNQRPAWLDHPHRTLDAAVAEAYGWGDDWRAGRLGDDAILAHLFALNQARARA